MLITILGPDERFFDNAFFDSFGEVDLDLVSATSTRVEVVNNSTGAVTVFNGTGFTFSSGADPAPTGGTITSIGFFQSGASVASLTGISWDLVALNFALDQDSQGNPQPLNNLVTSSGPITVDATNSTVPLLEFGIDFLPVPYTVLGTQFGDSLVGGDANDRLEGRLGDDTLNGGATGNDTLEGGLGSDELFGGAGNDLLNPGDNNNYDYIVAGIGNDTITFDDATADAYFEIEHGDLNNAITVNINGNTNTGSIDKGASGTTTLVNVANSNSDFNSNGGLQVDGTRFDDVFNITNLDTGWMAIKMGQGNDTLNLGASTGFMRLDLRDDGFGTAATQGVVANLATGVIANDGFGFTDTISGPGRINELRASFENDNITGSAGNDSFILMAGNDTLDGGDGIDRVRYDRNGVTNLDVNLATNTATGLWARNGENLAFTHSISNVENVRGSRDAADAIRGDQFNNMFEGRGGDDTLLGEGGDDTLYLGLGNDLGGGGAGNDSIIGEAGANTIYGGAGDDTVQGGSGNDTVYGGGTGTNSLLGNDGDDLIFTGGGGDFVGGGAGNDIIRGNAGADTIFGGVGNNNVGGGGGDDIIRMAGGADTVYGGAGNDNIGGGAGNDLIYGSAGSNVIYGGAGSDTVQGGTGADTIYGGGEGANVLLGNDGADQVYGSLGNDFIGGGAGNDTTLGGDGADTIYAGTGDDFVGGGAGNDVIYGGAGGNRVYGGTGNDTFVAGAGRDVVTGGPGVDTFVFNSAAQIGVGAARDVITDFTSGTDKIDLSALETQFNGAAGLSGGGTSSFYYFAGGGLLIGDADGNGSADWVLELSGAPTIGADDFIL
ncbi:calcium-binding protein [Sulfitobacter sabulilitoris]|uniref:Calcium-binding protein n=1 Tax=Sulfitobacter sabulilitoris TaxID=2562655 RepID=A0A5S3P7M0_9RHOB|nr:calcium-binding protein [Sulfitobacter sabulilitoris]TMM49383.1 hypothetical protein FDT80_18255 [Sulfitobacter sabulilitoris]